MDEIIALEAQIRAAIPRARVEAHTKGAMHPLWDCIFDGEAILAGKPTALRGTRLDRLREIVEALKEPY